MTAWLPQFVWNKTATTNTTNHKTSIYTYVSSGSLCINKQNIIYKGVGKPLSQNITRRENIGRQLAIQLQFIEMTIEGDISNSSSHQHQFHDDIIKWKHFPRLWPFVRGIHRSVTQRFYVFFFICAWTNGCANNRGASDLRRHHAHHDVAVILLICSTECTKPLSKPMLGYCQLDPKEQTSVNF